MTTPPEPCGTVPSTGGPVDLHRGCVLAHMADLLGRCRHRFLALPLAGTAALDLLEAVDVREGDTLLVVGATGGWAALPSSCSWRPGGERQ